MALPVSLSGILTSGTGSVLGPYKSSGGNYYFIARDNTNTNRLKAYKATDPTTSWSNVGTNQDVTGASTSSTNGSIGGCQNGDVIAVVTCLESTTAANSCRRFFLFDMSSDTWSVTNELITADSSTLGTNWNMRSCGVVYRPTAAEYVCFFNHTTVANMTTFYCRVWYSRRTGTNTFTSPVNLQTDTGTVDHILVGLAVYADRVHLHLATASANGQVRVLSAANAVSAATALNSGRSGAHYFPWANGTVAFDSAGTGKVLHARESSTAGSVILARANSSDSAAVAGTLNSAWAASSPLRLFVDNSTFYAVYRGTADNDLYVRSSTDDGATWSSATNIFTASVGADEIMSKDGGVYIQGGNYVIPYIVEDTGSALKYNEYILRSAVVTTNTSTAIAGDTALDVRASATGAARIDIASAGAATFGATRILSTALQVAGDTTTSIEGSTVDTTVSGGLVVSGDTSVAPAGTTIISSALDIDGESIVAPVGAVAGAVTWNPADKAAGITLSNGDLTATGSGSTPSTRASVRGTLAHSSGVWAFDVTVDAHGQHLGIGIANSTLPMSGTGGGSAWAGSDTDGIGYYADGFSAYNYNASGPWQIAGTYTVGDVVRAEVDFVGETVTFFKNGVQQGTSFSPGSTFFSAPLYPVFYAETSGDSGTADFSDWVDGGIVSASLAVAGSTALDVRDSATGAARIDITGDGAATFGATAVLSTSTQVAGDTTTSLVGATAANVQSADLVVSGASAIAPAGTTLLSAGLVVGGSTDALVTGAGIGSTALDVDGNTDVSAVGSVASNVQTASLLVAGDTTAGAVGTTILSGALASSGATSALVTGAGTGSALVPIGGDSSVVVAGAGIGSAALDVDGDSIVAAIGSTVGLGATWNPADKYSNVTLSNADLTATGAVGSNGAVRSTTSHNSGNPAFEVTVVGSGEIAVGIANSSLPISGGAYAGNTNDAIAYYHHGYATFDDGGADIEFQFLATYGAGDVIRTEVDFTAQTVKFFKNGVQQGSAFTPPAYFFSDQLFALAYFEDAGGSGTADFDDWAGGFATSASALSVSGSTTVAADGAYVDTVSSAALTVSGSTTAAPVGIAGTVGSASLSAAGSTASSLVGLQVGGPYPAALSISGNTGSALTDNGEILTNEDGEPLTIPDLIFDTAALDLGYASLAVSGSTDIQAVSQTDNIQTTTLAVAGDTSVLPAFIANAATRLESGGATTIDARGASIWASRLSVSGATALTLVARGFGISDLFPYGSTEVNVRFSATAAAQVPISGAGDAAFGTRKILGAGLSISGASDLSIPFSATGVAAVPIGGSTTIVPTTAHTRAVAGLSEGIASVIGATATEQYDKASGTSVGTASVIGAGISTAKSQLAVGGASAVAATAFRIISVPASLAVSGASAIQATGRSTNATSAQIQGSADLSATTFYIRILAATSAILGTTAVSGTTTLVMASRGIAAGIASVSGLPVNLTPNAAMERWARTPILVGRYDPPSSVASREYDTLIDAGEFDPDQVLTGELPASSILDVGEFDPHKTFGGEI
jgi:hypothetical protein